MTKNLKEWATARAIKMDLLVFFLKMINECAGLWCMRLFSHKIIFRIWEWYYAIDAIYLRPIQSVNQQFIHRHMASKMSQFLVSTFSVWYMSITVENWMLCWYNKESGKDQGVKQDVGHLLSKERIRGFLKAKLRIFSD